MRLIGVSVFVIAVLSGCTAGGGGGGDDDDEACAGPLGTPLKISEINAMTACCQADGGQAHCLEDSKVPGEIQPFLATCEAGGFCTPDSFLETGAAVPPQTCTAFGGSGVCLSICIPQVAENAGILRQEGCTGADDLCVPCISPLDGTETGACDLLELARCEGDDPPDPVTGCDDPATCNYEANCPPFLDVSTLPSCAPDAHCLDPALAGAEASRLGLCDDGVKLCVPDTFIVTGGKFTPATCASVGGAEGRCLSTVLPDVKAQEGLLPQDTCAATERCTPCFNPLDGTPTGACNLSCDSGPTTQPMPLASCCDGRAKCVPATSIPDDQEEQLSEQECEDSTPGALCVPNEIIANGPFPMCEADSFILGEYTGVCLSDCLDFGFQGIALAQGNCQDNFTCAPCTQNGQPTGAPGCPP